MKHHHQLIAVDLATGGAVDYDAIGAHAQEVRLHFASAVFPSVDDHRDALHRHASDHALTLHHFQGIMPENMVETEHEGQPAFILTVRRP